MAWDGNGNFVRTNGTNSGSATWAADASAGTAILSTRHDTHDEDLATGIENCLAKNGENTPTANLPMGAFKHTGVGNAAARNQYAAAGQIQDGALTYADVSTGAANAYAGSLTPAVTALVEGLRISWVANHTNTGAATYNLNALGTQNIRKGDGTTALSAGDLVANNYYEMLYDGANWVLLGHPASIQTTWTPSYTCNGSMTIGSTATAHAIYEVSGTKVTVSFSFTGTLAGSASDQVRISLPITAGTQGDIFFTCYYSNNGDAGSVRVTEGAVLSGSTYAILYKNTGGNHTLSDVDFRGQFSYFR